MSNDSEHLELRIQSLQSDVEKLTSTIRLMAGGLKKLDRYFAGNEQWCHGVMNVGLDGTDVVTPRYLVRSLIARAKTHRRR